jgi:hypothetical protein
MTRRLYLQDRQRDQRRRREQQRIGKLFADAVRERREQLQRDTAAQASAEAATAPPGDGRVDALEASAAVATAIGDDAA